MEKIFKKSLALVLSAALCLTALVGCLTVSAEGTTAKPTYALDAVEGKPGDTVTVTATLSNLNKVCAEHIKVTFPAGLAIGDITDGNGKVYTRLTETTDVTDPNLVGLYSKTTTADNGTLIQFVDFVNWPNADGTYTNVVESLVIKFAVTISAEAVAGHVYDITAAVDAADYAADKPMDVDITNGSVTVKAAVACDHANAQYSYSVVDGNCVTKLVCPDCGHEEIVATVANKTITPNMVFASGLAVRYRVKQSDVTDYTNIYALISKDTYNNTTNAYIGESTPVNIPAAKQGKNWQFEYKGITSYEMTCTIHVKVFGTDAEGNVLLLGASDSAFADYLKTRLATTGTYSDAYMNFFADTLRYGAASQKFNGYRTDALATDGVETTYGTALPTTFENTTSIPGDNNVVEIIPVAVYSNSLMFRIRFDKSAVSEYYDAGTLKMTIDYTDAYGKAHRDEASADKFTNATNGKRWQYQFEDLPAAFIGDYITIKIWNGDNEIASLKYSFQTYAENMYKNHNGKTDQYGALSLLCQAALSYSKSAKLALGY